MVPKRFYPTLLAGAVALAGFVSPVDADNNNRANRVLVITIDGLRPDYVTEEIMPNLYQMKQDGAYGARSSTVFPSFTRPNRTSIPTGVYPGKHGVINNHLPHPDDGSPVHTGSRGGMLDFEKADGRPMVTAVSLGEILDLDGDRLLTMGTGAWLQNHRGKGKGWWMPGDNFYPEEAREEVLAAVGESPSGARSPERTAWTVDLYLHDSLSDDPAEVVLMWLGNTDRAGHAYGVGAPETLEALADTDANIGRIIAEHEANGIDDVNIFVTSDHGFTTSVGGFSSAGFIEEAGLEDHVSHVRNMFYIDSGEREHLEQMVEYLQRNENVGTIYTRPKNPGDSEGEVPGTLSMEVVQWYHPRSSDIIAAPAWSDDENEYGWPGSTTRAGTATHGSDSPWDLQIPLIAMGPDIKDGLYSRVPTANVDITPTILHIRGIAPLASMDGRVLHELLVDGPAPEEVEFERELHRTWRFFDDGFRYETTLETMTVGDTVYLRGAYTERGE